MHWDILYRKYTINTFKYIQVHSNALKYIQIYYKYIEKHHKCIINTFKYIQIYYEYIQIPLSILKIHSNTFKSTQILSNILKYIINTLKYTINIL
jgi:hypothetical protein